MSKYSLIIIGVILLVVAAISALRALDKNSESKGYNKSIAIIFLLFGLLITFIGIFK